MVWYGMVWNATILNKMFLTLSCFQVISAVLIYKTWSKTQTLSFSPRVSMIFRVCIRTSLTVDISVAGRLIVGR